MPSSDDAPFPRTDDVTDAPVLAIDVPRFRLTVTAGPDTGQAILAEGGPVTIGSHASANLVLTDRTVSRFHVELSIRDAIPIVRDQGSRNGTRVDGVPVIEAPLRDGAILALGATQVRFDLGAERGRVELSQRERFGDMVGRSRAMRALFKQLERAAPTDATILLEGETGTGKEVAAASIHAESPRAGGPFVVVDCGALAHELVESELFGHERGAFTGADRQRKGAFELAHGGTIFLDEIGELETDLQPKLLRTLEERVVRRIGSGEARPVDVRVIAATNRRLVTEVNEGRFRPDLYFRLAVVPIRLPPLRERLDDLPLLVDRLLEELAPPGADTTWLRTPAALVRLARHPWSGNVRELRNHVERCVIVGEEQAFDAEGGDPAVARVAVDRPMKVARELWLREFERRYLREVLDAHQGNVRAAATTAGVDRTYFYRLLWRHGLK